MFLAHIRTDGQGTAEQLLVDHSRNVAAYAASCLREVGLAQTGRLLGLLHDCGKWKREFQTYLKDPQGVRGSVNHSFAGVRLLLERYHASEDILAQLAAELLAFAVGSHHGLFDCVEENGRSGFDHRLQKEGIGYRESVGNFLAECVSEEELDEGFAQALAELSAVVARLGEGDYTEYQFRLGLLARLLLSALIEGDRRDTAEFMTAQARSAGPADRSAFWRPYRMRVEEKLSRLPADSAIGRARREISARCRAMAEKPGGIYRLNVPTGAGKTLASLRYALAHGEKWGKQRLIFTSPLLSILEQNAAVLREYVGDDSIILEHHSNLLRPREEELLDGRELAIESWDAPIIPISRTAAIRSGPILSGTPTARS